MRAQNASPVLSPTRAMQVDCAQSALVSLPPIPPLRSVASASARIGNLVRRAMTFFDTNREAAWCCLRDASTLLGSETEGSDINSPALHGAFRTGGLAVWQAKRTIAYIEANLGSKLAIREMADLVALSKCHFSRAFKLTLGTSPMAYLGVRRVERAKLMMASTGQPLADIALACGFADQSHLSRYFRRIVGVSPSLWRRVSQYETRVYRRVCEEVSKSQTRSMPARSLHLIDAGRQSFLNNWV
jgi:AraC family transcriptional regulator